MLLKDVTANRVERNTLADSAWANTTPALVYSDAKGRKEHQNNGVGRNLFKNNAFQ